MSRTTGGRWIAAAVLAVAGPAMAALTNPGFETGDFSGWSTFGDGWRTSAWGGDVHTGAWGIVSDVTHDSFGSTWRGVFQNVPATAGETYSGGVWLHTAGLPVPAHSESWFEVQFLDGGNVVLGQYQSAHVTADQAYAWMGVSSMVAPAGTVQASVRGIVYSFGDPGVGATEYHVFDDFAFAVVPEPASAGLVAAMAAVALVRRRRVSR